jgi:hypothetical protein
MIGIYGEVPQFIQFEVNELVGNKIQIVFGNELVHFIKKLLTGMASNDLFLE